MRVVVAGGTGFIGRILVKRLTDAGHRVTVLTRSLEGGRRALGPAVELALWPEPGWEEVIDGADGVINLAGEPIADKRWTAERKRRLLESRTQSTRRIVQAIQRAQKKPSVLVNGSAVGFYGRTHTPVDEEAPPGNDFLAEVTVAWESEARKAAEMGVRVALIRTGIVLGTEGGALPRMLLPFRLFAGGPIGSGRQPFPWIHWEDEVGLILFALTHESVRGPLNAVAPELVDNATFSRVVGQVMRRPSWLPVPGFAMRMLFGEMADAMLLDGQAVVPAKALQYGYQFKYPKLQGALEDIL